MALTVGRYSTAPQEKATTVADRTSLSHDGVA